eukprot:1160850-Pelagomonas_calceolata.AAC.7
MDASSHMLHAPTAGHGYAGAQPVGPVEPAGPIHVSGDGGMHRHGGALDPEGVAQQGVSACSTAGTAEFDVAHPVRTYIRNKSAVSAEMPWWTANSRRLGVHVESRGGQQAAKEWVCMSKAEVDSKQQKNGRACRKPRWTASSKRMGAHAKGQGGQQRANDWVLTLKAKVDSKEQTTGCAC